MSLKSRWSNQHPVEVDLSHFRCKEDKIRRLKCFFSMTLCFVGSGGGASCLAGTWRIKSPCGWNLRSWLWVHDLTNLWCSSLCNWNLGPVNGILENWRVILGNVLYRFLWKLKASPDFSVPSANSDSIQGIGKKKLVFLLVDSIVKNGGIASFFLGGLKASQWE